MDRTSPKLQYDQLDHLELNSVGRIGAYIPKDQSQLAVVGAKKANELSNGQKKGGSDYAFGGRKMSNGSNGKTSHKAYLKNMLVSRLMKRMPNLSEAQKRLIESEV